MEWLRSLFGSNKGPRLRKMRMQDLDAVCAIIEEHDEDDAENARASISERRADGMYVLVDGPRVLGVTGAHIDEFASGVAWLSWTYLTNEARGTGLGRTMVDSLLGILDKKKIRKAFIATSDYLDDGVDIYADARALYESFGAELELQQPDFHEPGETRIVYGLSNPAPPSANDTFPTPPTEIEFDGFEPAPESRSGFLLTWHETEQDISSEDHLETLNKLVAEASSSGSRIVVVALPAAASDRLTTPLTNAGFKIDGRLHAYYSPGCDEVHWSLNTTKPS